MIRQFLLAASLTAMLGCGQGSERAAGDDSPPGQAAAGELSAFEIENGIGPVTEPLALGPVDTALATQGAALFEGRCSGCHKMEERYVGPPLGGVLTRRTPAYVMNMILNPDTMYQRHPEARAMLAQYATQMPNLGLTIDQARQILEHLRVEDEDED